MATSRFLNQFGKMPNHKPCNDGPEHPVGGHPLPSTPWHQAAMVRMPWFFRPKKNPHLFSGSHGAPISPDDVKAWRALMHDKLYPAPHIVSRVLP